MKTYFDKHNVNCEFGPRVYEDYQMITKYIPQLSWDSEAKREEAFKILREVNYNMLRLDQRFADLCVDSDYYRPRNPKVLLFPWNNNPITLIDEEIVFLDGDNKYDFESGIEHIVSSFLLPKSLLPNGRIEIEKQTREIEKSEIIFSPTYGRRFTS
jgi:hypothetical protein